MAQGFKTGSVTAEIALDTKQFDEAIKRLKQEVQSLKTDFGSLEGTNAALVEVIEELKSEVKSLTRENKNSKKTVEELLNTNDKLRNSVENIQKEYKNARSELKKEQSENARLVTQLEKVSQATNDVVVASENIVKQNKEIVASEKEVQASMKQTESQTKKTSATLRKEFTQEFSNLIKTNKANTRGFLDLKPIYNQMKSQFKGLVSGRREFENLFREALLSTSTRLIPARNGEDNVRFLMGNREKGFGYIDASNFREAKAAIKEVKEETEKVVESTKKAAQTVKEVTTEEKQLETQAKKTATSIQKQFTEMLYERVRSYGSKGTSAVFADGFRNQMKYLYSSMDSAEFEKRLSQALKDMGIKTKGKGSMETWGFGGFFKPDFDNIQEIVNETEKVTESTKKATEAVKEEVAEIKKEGTTAKEAAQETIKANEEKIASEKKVQEAVKQTEAQTKKKSANATRYTADEVRLLKEMYDHFQYRADLGDKNAPFARNYRFFEEEYKNLFTKLDTTNPNMARRIKEQFMRKFQKFANVLGVDLVQGAFEGVLAEGTPRYTNFLGKRIGSYDLSNLISEEEFKQLIGELEQVEVEEKKVTESVKQSAEAIKEETKQISEEAKTTKKVAEETVKANEDKINSNKKVKKSVKETTNELKKTNEESTRTGKSVQKTLDMFTKSSDKTAKSVKKVSSQYSELGKVAGTAVKGLGKFQEDLELHRLVNGAEKATKVTRNLNKEITRTVAQSKKLEADIFTSVTTETSKYLANLGRGRKSNLRGLLDSNKAVWSDHDGIETRLFDGKKLQEHLRKTFKGILTDNELSSAIKEIGHQFGLGDVAHNVEGLWGIPREGLEMLNSHASAFGMTMEKLVTSIRKVMAETSGMKEQFSEPINTSVIDNARKSLEFLKSDEKKAEEEIKRLKQALTDLGNTPINKVSSSLEKYLNIWAEAPITVKRSAEEINAAVNSIMDLNKRDIYVPLGGDDFKRYSNNWETTTKQIQNATKGFDTLERRLKSTEINVEGFNQIYEALGGTIHTNNANIRNALNVLKIYDGGVEKSKQILKEYEIQTKKTFETMQVELAKANAAQYKYWKQVRGSANIKGWNAEPLKITGYNEYLMNIKSINTELERLKKLKQSVNTKTNYSSKDIATAGQQLARMNTELEKEIRLTKLSNRQLQLWHKYHRIDRGNYISNMNEINAKLKEQTTNLKGSSSAMITNETNVRKLGRGLTTFNNGVVQTAHSGRILSNTLYQIRGALLSLKMIFTAMGGMMLWGFAMELGESVKSTITAKNEMEAQLKQRFTSKKTGRTDWASIQYVRKELDKLPKTFQKVNKYAIGETVSSIGLEFDLTAKQMKDALPIVTMVSSEYVRAGRKEEEAALAVKDILQGEFQRLSRETGVGKEELIDFGWSGEKEDLDTLLEAIKKAALSRHWDTFAAKATSLNDVVTITKSRFSELGAEVVDSLTPAIVGGFNMVIDALSGLQNAFNSMGSFGRNFTLFGGVTAGLGGILTALPMITKQMGLAEIATIGWRKSILTAALNLNKTEVRLYGFRKALAAVITGTQASEIANVRSSKAILGRLLGVKQAAIAERGLMSALVETQLAFKGESLAISSAELATMSFRQKLTYLVGNISIADAKTAGWGRTIKSIATSTKLWGIAIKGVMATGFLLWITSVAAWADTVKNRMEKYNDVLASGKDEMKSMQKHIDSYDKKLQETSPSDPKYGLYATNKSVLEHNLESMKLAYKYAKQIKKETAETEETNKARISKGLDTAYEKAGLKNVLERTNTYQQMKYAAYDIQKSEEEAYNFSYASLQHINEKIGFMKQDAELQAKQITDEKERAKFEKEAQDKRVKYITEYSTKAEEAAKHLKQFNQGDVTAGAYYLMDRLSLAWIDLWNDSDFTKFWDTVKRTFEDLKPTLIEIKNIILDVGRNLIKFFSTDQGRWVGAVAVAAGAFGLLAWKLKGVFGKARDAVSGLKGVWKWIRKTKDVSDKGGDVLGGESDTKGTDSGTGKIWKKGEFKESIINDAKTIAQKYAKAGVHLALLMGLVTEAILLIQAPMWALAETGKTFKAKEKSIRAGIEGLQLVAPTVIALLIPIMALVKVMDLWGKQLMNWKTLGATAVGIATGMLFVAEAIVMLKAPMWSLSQIGKDYAVGKSDIKGGITAMQVLGDSLKYLVPFVPMFLVGIGLAAACFAAPEVGLLATGAVVGGIALGMLLLAEAVVTLRMPLEAIRELGNSFTDIEGAKKGAEALKVTAEAMGYVEDAMSSMVLVHWELIADAIAQLITKVLDIKLSDLTDEGGFFDQLEQFTTQFNKLELTPINPDKVTALQGVSDGLGTVGTALQNAKTAVDNIPSELKNGGLNVNYDMETDTTSIKSEDITSYFDRLKEPLNQLGEFISWFNTELQIPSEGVDADKLQAINDSANMLQSVNDAVSKVRDVMGNSILTGGLSNINSEGIPFGGVGALGGLLQEGWTALSGGGASGSYKSSLGSSFQQMEDIISDLSTFSTNISSYTTNTDGQSGNLESLTTFVQGVSTQISTLVTTLNDKVPEAKQNAESLGKGIIDGIKAGLVGIEKVGTYITSTVANSIMLSKDTTYNTANSLGKTTASKFREGVNPMSEYMTWELFYVGKALDDQKESLGQKAYNLGSYIASRFKEGDDINSPGIMARSMQDEMNYIGQYLSTNNLPQMAFDLANALTSNFNLDFNLSNFKLPDMSQWTSQLSTVIPTVDNIKTQVSTNFNTMKTNVQNSFTNIVSKTQSSMSSMKSATISHIGGIKTSWKGMQDALIASAEHIRSQTASKIDKLKTNMGDFWNKIKHPDQLVGGSAGGKPRGTIPRRTSSKGFAGSPMFKPKISRKDPSDYEREGLLCQLLTGKPCYSGGWDFDWTPKISGKFKGWNTHFNKFKLDSHLNVGKFENSNFPVKGQVDVFRDYISEVIGATTYDYYYDGRYSPAEALRRGSFNCYDGTRVILALANAFGLTGGGMGHGTWGKDGHVWATIPGIGVIDPTAIQRGYGFKSPKVKGYGAGSPTRSSHRNAGAGNTTTNNNEVHIHIEGDVYGVDDLNSKIEEGANRVAQRLFRNSYSGV